jgi:hypothetical protein
MRVIIVPKDKNAEERLDYGEERADQILSFIFDEEIFKRLWNLRFFQRINDMTGCLIDVYEDDRIVEVQKLNNVLNSGLFCTENYANELKTTIAEIKKLFEEAKVRNTGVHFYF